MALGGIFPRILGHEGAGYVAKVGSKVTVAQVGDPVLLSFASCSSCYICKGGFPSYCEAFVPLNIISNEPDYALQSSPDTKFGGRFFGQSSFSNLAVVGQSSVVNVKGLIDNDEDLKMCAPLGCGIQTGSGTILRAAHATPEDTVVVVGLGGVGLSAILVSRHHACIHSTYSMLTHKIQGAKVAGCRKIVAVDILDHRVELAKSLGATDGINSKKLPEGTTLHDAVRAATDGVGPSISMDTTGNKNLIAQAMKWTRNKAKIIQVGSAPMDAQLDISLFEHMVAGKQFIGAIEGDSIPSKSVPELIKWYKEGRFPFDKLIKFYPAAEFQQALKDTISGDTVKPVLVW